MKQEKWEKKFIELACEVSLKLTQNAMNRNLSWNECNKQNNLEIKRLIDFIKNETRNTKNI